MGGSELSLLFLLLFNYAAHFLSLNQSYLWKNIRRLIAAKINKRINERNDGREYLWPARFRSQVASL